MNELQDITIRLQGKIINNQNYCVISLTKDNKEKISILQRESENRIFQTISHELGTCTNFLYLFISSAILDEQVNEYTKVNYLKNIDLNVFLISQIVQDIRDYHSYQNGILKVIWKEHELGDIILKVCQFYAKIAAMKDITFNFDIINLPQKVYIDQKKVQSIMVNLLSNAFKFSPRNSIISAKIKYIQQQNIIKLKVKDNGIGMNEEEQLRLQQLLDGQYLFQKISQQSSGFGFGLSISNILIKLMLKNNKFIDESKKNLQFKSRYNKGSSFWFYIDANAQDKMKSMFQEDSYIFKKDKNLQNSVFENSIQLKEQKIFIINDQEIIEQDCPEFTPCIKSQQRLDNFTSLGLDQLKELKKYKSSEYIKMKQTTLSKIQNRQTCKYLLTKSIVGINEKTNSDNCDDLSRSEGVTVINIPFSKPKQFMTQNLIMIIDDEPMNICGLQILIKVKFGLNGSIILTAYNGLEGFQKYQEHFQQIRMIFMDVNMPIMDGIECTKEIRNFEIQNKTKRANIVGYSSYSDVETKLKCQQSGMDNYYTKPISYDVLQSALERYYFNRKF